MEWAEWLLTEECKDAGVVVPVVVRFLRFGSRLTCTKGGQVVLGDDGSAIPAVDPVLVQTVPGAVVGMRTEGEREAITHRGADEHELEHRGRGGLAPFQSRDRRLRNARALGQHDLAQAGIDPTPTELGAEAPEEPVISLICWSLVGHGSIVAAEASLPHIGHFTPTCHGTYALSGLRYVQAGLGQGGLLPLRVT